MIPETDMNEITKVDDLILPDGLDGSRNVAAQKLD